MKIIFLYNLFYFKIWGKVRLGSCLKVVNFLRVNVIFIVIKYFFFFVRYLVFIIYSIGYLSLLVILYIK